MKFNDDYYEEERDSGSKIVYVYMILLMSVVILGVTALVFWANQSKSKSDGSGYAAAVAQKEAKAAETSKKLEANAAENVIAESKLTSNDLDIWTLPDTGREKKTSGSNKGNGTVTNQTTGETVVDGTPDKSDSNDRTQTAEELSNGKTSVYDMTNKENTKDDKDSDKEKEKDEEDKKDEDEEEETRIQVKHADGSKEWVDINNDIAKNKYDFSKLTYQNPLMNYTKDGKIVSKCGVDISANQGDVDFDKLKKAGCDFVMIKVGARGYSSGKIVMDENYKENLKAAKKAGLDIGVYFCSQAVNKAEAREEADELLDAVADANVSLKYPAAFVMENVDDDMARIEALDMTDRTQVAKAFMDRIEDNGYTPVVYGDKEWLLTMVDMEELQDYDVWYAQDSDKPDYPYEFAMWQYDSDASIKGIKGNAAMIISFKDYKN